jgi:hypothetical protein
MAGQNPYSRTNVTEFRHNFRALVRSIQGKHGDGGGVQATCISAFHCVQRPCQKALARILADTPKTSFDNLNRLQ